MFFNPAYLLVFLVPALLVSGLAHWWIRKVYRESGQVIPQSGASGSDAAAAVLTSAGVNAVFVEDIPGQLLDHYSPAEKGLFLRPEVHDGRTLMAVGIAGHEAGHALQDAANHPLLPARTAIVLAAMCGGLTGLILFVGGFILVESILVYTGIAVFTVTVLAQLFNLGVEFDASRRARQHLLATGVITPDEEWGVRRVMQAAAFTYVAATLTSPASAYFYLVRPWRLARLARAKKVV
jgi:uncharacterized protein